MISCIVIDDDQSITEAYSDCLKALGMDVLGKGFNGKDAVELYQKVNPDIVFLDLDMPEYDGFHAIDEITKMNPSANIIVVTAFRDDEAVKRLQAKNITFYDKPFGFHDFSKIVEKLKQS